jgi:hypothetical protein
MDLFVNNIMFYSQATTEFLACQIDSAIADLGLLQKRIMST